MAPDLFGLRPERRAAADRSAYSIDRYADLVAALVADLGLGPVVLVGLSMGGYIALAVARRHPEVLAALVLADTRADPDSPEGRQTRSDHQALVEERGDVIAAGRRPAEPDPVRDRAPAAPEVRAFLGRHDALDRPRRLDRRPGSHEATPRPDRPAAAIAVPTLVVVGESDALVPLDVAEAMAKAIPGARLEVVPDAGHVANLENPDVFNRIFAEFLSTLPGRHGVSFPGPEELGRGLVVLPGCGRARRRSPTRPG